MGDSWWERSGWIEGGEGSARVGNRMGFLLVPRKLARYGGSLLETTDVMVSVMAETCQCCDVGAPRLAA